MSLAVLYARVPAAEEEDLLEQHAAEQHQEELSRRLALCCDDVDAPQPVPQEPEAAAPAGPEGCPTQAQAVGIVRQLLGAVVLEER